MKYHYQQGIIEKDKKGHRKVWLGFFVLFGAIVYGGFVFTTLALNGFPLQSVNTTAALIKTAKPGSLGNHLFIPAINLTAHIGGSLSQSGNPGSGNVILKGSQLAFGLTPNTLRASSPFFNLGQLTTDDQIFLDNNGTRYVYKVTGSLDPGAKKLTLESKGGTTLEAEAIGTVAWDGGSSKIQTF
jgi:hypothetical protein